MYDVRFCFEKRGRAKYISHLDLYRCFTRAFKRSGLPVWYTQGFNQHVYLTFALPMSLGMEGLGEILDLRFTEDIDFAWAQDQINNALPEGIRVLSIAKPEKKVSAITSADYDIFLSSETVSPEELLKGMEAFLKHDTILATKKSKKKGEVVIDIRPYFDKISNLHISEDKLTFSVVLPVGMSLTINPSLLINSFLSECFPENVYVSVIRKSIYDEEGKVFA